MALSTNTAASISEGQEVLDQASSDLRLGEIARNPEFATGQLKIVLSYLQQILQVANRQEVLALLTRDVSLSVSHRRLLTELLGEGDQTVSGKIGRAHV